VADDSATGLDCVLTRELVRLGHESIVGEDGAQAWEHVPRLGRRGS